MQQVPQASGRVSFILVEPSHPGNIGAAARAIKTMGFTDLRVVSPKEVQYRQHPDAVALSTSSHDVLEASRDYPDLLSALEGVNQAFALSGYNREFGPPIEDLKTSAARAAAWLTLPFEQTGGNIAFVFGCERSGLTNEQIGLCQTCTAIPANPNSTSLNLSQAVMLTAYEMQQALLKGGHEHELYAWQDRFAHQPAAGVQAIEGFLEHWQQAMIACGALNPAEPKNLMQMSRRLFTRAGLTQSEVDLLRGICAAIVCPRRDRVGRKNAANAARQARAQDQKIP